MKMKRNELITLTNDPSITAWGWAVVSGDNEILDAGCIATKPEHKKRRIRTGDDTCRRVSYIVRRLLNIIDTYKVNYILSELPHGSQSAPAAKMIGITTGIAQTIADTLGISIEWYSEMDTKVCVLDKRSCTKFEMIQAIDKLYAVPWKVTKYVDEAIADALAVYYTASQLSNVLKFYKS